MDEQSQTRTTNVNTIFRRVFDKVNSSKFLHMPSATYSARDVSGNCISRNAFKANFEYSCSDLHTLMYTESSCNEKNEYTRCKLSLRIFLKSPGCRTSVKVADGCAGCIGAAEVAEGCCTGAVGSGRAVVAAIADGAVVASVATVV